MTIETLNETVETVSNADAQYDTLIVGGGPAGLGPLVAASKLGKLGELLDKKICVVEKGPFVGGGNLNNFAINSDTPGGIMLECFTEQNEEMLKRLKSFPGTQTLQERDGNYVPLALIGEFLNHLGSCIQDEVENHPASDIYVNSEVLRIDIDGDGKHIIRVKRTLTDGSSEIVNLTANKVIMAPGGVQYAKKDIDKPLFGTTTCIADFPEKTFIESDSVLKNRENFQQLVSRINNGEDHTIVVIGSSHSAFSSTLFLFKQLKESAGRVRVKIVYRSEPKIFYPSVDEAHADGYTDFDERDICVTTDRVYRFGGLRMESRDLLRRIGGFDKDAVEERVELVKFTNEEELRNIFAESSVIISALGYKPNYMPIFDAEGREIELGNSIGKYVDQNCRLLDSDGKVIENVFGVGLASGFVPNNGGEPSFRGQTNSIWIYQSPAGNILLNEIL